MDRPVIEDAIVAGRLDMGLSIVSNTENLQRFEHQVLIRSRRQLWLSSEHPLMRASVITLEDVARHPYILPTVDERSEEHTSELQSLMRISYAVVCLKKK